MTVKRQWMLALMLSAALSVFVNSAVFSARLNRYFIDYSTQNYKSHLNQVVAFSTDALTSGDYTRMQLEMQLESHLNDPIKRIRLYNAGGKLLADVGSSGETMADMMRNRMINRAPRTTAEEVDSVDITQNGVLLGKLNITRYSSIGNSLATQAFKRTLVVNSLLSFGIALLFLALLSDYYSKRMSRDLTLTAQQASDIDLGRRTTIHRSSIVEIGSIQQSLDTLQSRLLMKQAGRKKRIDELVHQTRTPLTILRTHLEGFQDGVIQFSPEEIKTCESQIDNLTAIIANMSGLIDAEEASDSATVAPVELSALIKQIAAGLKAQFDRKQVALHVEPLPKISLMTDSYLLSQAIYNLLTNAYKFTPPDGSVTVSAQLAGSEVDIAIADTGVGIAPAEQARIFEAYYRGESAGATGGEGLGLYIVRENLRRIGGRVSVESKPGSGSRFIIRLPKSGAAGK